LRRHKTPPKGDIFPGSYRGAPARLNCALAVRGVKNNAAQQNIAKVLIWITINKNILIDFFDY
jgi:hypothetical protein